jgi:Uma2 family endonuclease
MTYLGPQSTGLKLSPEEFIAVEDCNELYHYELIHGVVVVSPIPEAAVRAPNDRFSYWLWTWHEKRGERTPFDETLYTVPIRCGDSVRLADRVIWTHLGRHPIWLKDVPSIVIDFVSNFNRQRRRDFDEKRVEYAAIGVVEYWVIDRFERTMSIFSGGRVKRVVTEKETYETPLLPGFQLPLVKVLEVAGGFSKVG